MTNDVQLLVHWVDAFTLTPFTGNPAVVVPEADGLSEEQMQLIAREVNCSETAFVTSTQQSEADLRLRWFTPTQEVDLCGHATVAALHTLAELGRFNLRPQTHQILYIETRSGVLPVTIDYSERVPWIWLTLPLCQFTPVEPELAAGLTQVLGLSGLSKAVVDSLNRDVLIAVDTLKTLHGLTPDFRSLARLGQTHDWRGICVYTTDTVDPAHAAHSRFFAPQSGIDEDPVTGSVSAPLAQYLCSVANAASPMELVLEQGDCLGRSGRVSIQLEPKAVKLGGQAVTLMQGTLKR